MKLFNFSAWGHVLAAFVLGSIFLSAAAFTLTTTQMLFEYGVIGVSQLHYTWDSLFQLSSIMNGDLSGKHLLAVIISWILLACYIMANSVKAWIKSGIAHETLHFFCHAMIILDGHLQLAALEFFHS
jgi:hypothetical protein